MSIKSLNNDRMVAMHSCRRLAQISTPLIAVYLFMKRSIKEARDIRSLSAIIQWFEVQHSEWLERMR